MSLLSGTILALIAVSLMASTVLLSKAIVDNLRSGDTEDNFKL